MGWLVISSTLLMAQESISGFSLKDYLYPDIRFQSLNLNGYLSNSFNQNQLGVADPNQPFPFNRNQGFGLTGLAQLATFRNTRRWQTDQFARLNLNPAWSQQETPTGREARSSRLAGSIDYRGNFRRYNDRNRFWGFGVQTGLALNQSNAFQRTWANNQQLGRVQNEANSQAVNLGGYIERGMGRLEQVQDAQHALQVIEWMEKAGGLTRQPTAAEVRALAEEISRLRRRRFFDERLQNIHALEQVDALLKEQGLAREDKASYYFQLQDIWRYGGQNLRLSGQRFSVGIGGFGSYKSQGSLREFENPQQGEGLTAGDWLQQRLQGEVYLSWRKEDPFKEQWQHSFSIDTRFQVEQLNQVLSERDLLTNEETRTEDDRTWPGFSAQMAYQLGFYPDTRTFLQLSLQHGISGRMVVDGANPPDNPWANISYQAQGQLSMYYYFSPRLRLEVFSRIVWDQFGGEAQPFNPGFGWPGNYRFSWNQVASISYALF